MVQEDSEAVLSCTEVLWQPQGTGRGMTPTTSYQLGSTVCLQQAEDYATSILAMKACKPEIPFSYSETPGWVGRDDKRDTAITSNLAQKVSLSLWTWDFSPTPETLELPHGTSRPIHHKRCLAREASLTWWPRESPLFSRDIAAAGK